MMKNPELYEKSNEVSRLVALDIINNYISKMKWQKDWDSAIDLGSADGSVTSLLKKYIPCRNIKFVGSDINENMVRFANEHHKDDKITFRVLDICADLPDDLKCAHNHVFSFLMLNCVKDQGKAFRNVYDILTDEGDCLLTIIKYVPSYDFFLNAAKKQKWGAYLKDVDKFISPYYKMQDPVANVTQMMKEIGFKNIDIQCKRMLYPLKNGTELKNLFKSVHPYDLPDDVFEELAVDCVHVAKDIGMLDQNVSSFEDHQEEIIYDSSVLIVYATKK